MTTYELLLFGHILFVIAWVGTGICLQFLGARAIAAGPQRAVQFLGDVDFLGKFMLPVTSLLVLVFGILLVNEVGYGFGDLWIVLAFAAFAFSFILGAGFLGPESGRIGKLVDEKGAEDPEISRRIKRIVVLSRIELVILVLVVLDMVAKPT